MLFYLLLGFVFFMIVDVCPYELAGLHSSFLIPEQIDVQHLHPRGFAHAAVCKLLNFYIFQASEHDLGGSESYQPA